MLIVNADDWSEWPAGKGVALTCRPKKWKTVGATGTRYVP